MNEHTDRDCGYFALGYMDLLWGITQEIAWHIPLCVFVLFVSSWNETLKATLKI